MDHLRSIGCRMRYVTRVGSVGVGDVTTAFLTSRPSSPSTFHSTTTTMTIKSALPSHMLQHYFSRISILSRTAATATFEAGTHPSRSQGAINIIYNIKKKPYVTAAEVVEKQNDCSDRIMVLYYYQWIQFVSFNQI